MRLTLDNQASLDAATLADLALEVGRHGSLVEALAFAPTVVDVVVQDEYTHDVVLGGRGPLFFVYDTT
jgi:hypothetical protein